MTRLRNLASDLGTEAIRYLLASVFSFAWIIGTSALWVEVVGLPEQIGVAIALMSALVANYALLRVFVFPGSAAPVGQQFLATALTSLAFRAVEYGVFLVLAGPGGLHYLLATAIGVTLSALGKFFVYRNLVFRRAGDAVA